MIILKVQHGFANQVYQFAAGYTLARELNQELMFDISLSYNGAYNTYMLDKLNIPEYKKLVYDFNTTLETFAYSEVVPEEILEGFTVCCDEYYQEFKNQYRMDVIYDGNINELSDLKNIYLIGNFQRRKFFDKYLSEIKKMITPLIKTSILKKFEKEVEGKNSIAVHIRRQNFIDENQALGDNYYKAAIRYMIENTNEPQFYIFSDDIDWAITYLGIDSSYHFINIYSGVNGDLDEFFCIKSCKHKILTKFSSFGRLASLLSDDKDQIIIYYDNNVVSNSEIIYLNDEMINDLCKRYYINNTRKNQRDKFNDIFNIQELKNPDEIQEKIEDIMLDMQELSQQERIALLYKKMIIDVNKCDYENALQISNQIMYYYDTDLNFHKYYKKILKELHRIKEEKIEIIRINKENNINPNRKHFIIYPYAGYTGKALCTGILAVGFLLRRMGNYVTFIYKDSGGLNSIRSVSTNNGSLKRDNNVIDIRGVLYDCKLVRLNNYGHNCNIYDVFHMVSKGDIENIIITRKENMIDQRLFKVLYYDYNQSVDPEYLECKNSDFDRMEINRTQIINTLYIKGSGNRYKIIDGRIKVIVPYRFDDKYVDAALCIEDYYNQ